MTENFSILGYNSAVAGVGLNRQAQEPGKTPFGERRTGFGLADSGPESTCACTQPDSPYRQVATARQHHTVCGAAVLVCLALLGGGTPAHGQPPVNQKVIVTISPQQSPFPLPKGLTLYSAEMCGSVARVVDAAQVRQVAENAGISFQDPALNASVLTGASSKTPSSRVLSVIKWASVGMSVGGGVITFLKSQQPQIGNASTWAEITTGTGALGAGLGILQPIIQSDANTQAVSITTGVQAALISDMTALYSVPANGCAKSVMFFGSGGVSKPAVGVIQ